MDLSNIKKVYIIGIEGAGTSAFARILFDMGFYVTGSDEGDHNYNDVLEVRGIKVFHKFDEKNLTKDIDLFVYSTANKPETNPELKKVLEDGKKVLSYPEALALIFNQNYGIAVCGSHGKTTTTGWLAYVLEKSGESPKAIIGSKVPQFSGNSLLGKSDLFVLEADEYQNKLKHYSPKAVVLNNIDYDHPDFFKTPEDYENVFIEFIKKISKKGFLVANFDDPIVAKFARVNCRGKVIGFGINNQEADILAYDIKYEAGYQFFKVKLKEEEETRLRSQGELQRSEDELGQFKIKLSGLHNIYNALAVIATSIELEVDLKDIRGALGEFAGTARRMQVLGEFRGATIIDDYAHHPTEIRATLSGARQIYGNRKIIAVFHPHTFTRTKALLDDFARSFKDADEVIVLDIYGSAREAQGGVHSKDLVDQLKIKKYELKIEQDIKYIPTLDEVEKYLREHVERNDVVLLMGAGDVFRVGEKLVKK